MQLAPSKNPEKESKQFSILGLACGAAGLFLWFVAIAGLAFSARGMILSNRVGSKQRLAMSICGLVLSVLALVWHLG